MRLTALSHDLDLAEIAELWRRGSVIGSWLLDLTAASLLSNLGLKDYAGRVSDSGEGRWTIAAAIDESVSAPVLSTALFATVIKGLGAAGLAEHARVIVEKPFGRDLASTRQLNRVLRSEKESRP